MRWRECWTGLSETGLAPKAATPSLPTLGPPFGSTEEELERLFDAVAGVLDRLE